MKNSKIYLIIFVSMLLGILISINFSYALAESLIDSKNVYYEDNSSLGFTNVQDAIDGTCLKFDNALSNLKQELINQTYPIGSIYISTTLKTIEEVNSKIGGEWEVYAKGQTLVGIDTNQKEFNSVEKIGGEKTHTLTIEEMPSHTHIQNAHSHIVMQDLTGGAVGLYPGSMQEDSLIIKPESWQIGLRSQPLITGNTTATNQTTGGSKEHNNLQPYIVVYMYKRIK